MPNDFVERRVNNAINRPLDFLFRFKRALPKKLIVKEIISQSRLPVGSADFSCRLREISSFRHPSIPGTVLYPNSRLLGKASQSNTFISCRSFFPLRVEETIASYSVLRLFYDTYLQTVPVTCSYLISIQSCNPLLKIRTRATTYCTCSLRCHSTAATDAATVLLQNHVLLGDQPLGESRADSGTSIHRPPHEAVVRLSTRR